MAKHRRRSLTLAVVLAAMVSVAEVPASAAPGALNLRIYAGMLGELRAALISDAAKSSAKKPPVAKVWEGPLLGYSCHRDPAPLKTTYCGTFSVFYARYGNKEYAVASFWSIYTGGTDQPERFERVGGGRWRLLGDTGFQPSCGVPAAVARVWGWPRCQG
jgi:hypothetical protein